MLPVTWIFGHPSSAGAVENFASRARMVLFAEGAVRVEKKCSVWTHHLSQKLRL